MEFLNVNSLSMCFRYPSRKSITKCDKQVAPINIYRSRESVSGKPVGTFVSLKIMNLDNDNFVLVTVNKLGERKGLRVEDK